jgi:hypothetical protein
MCEARIQQDFIAKNEQKQNKVMTRNIPKTNVERIKVMKYFTSIYAH